MLTLAVALAAGIGAVARYVLDQIIQHRASRGFPYGTFVINVTGSLLLGLVTGLALHHGFPSTATAITGAGFAGGLTTLSTWAWESLALAEVGELTAAIANIAVSFAVGLAAAGVGFGLALL